MILGLPILIPMLAAAVCLALWGRPRTIAAISVITTAVMSAVAVELIRRADRGEILTLQVGGWDAPFGITLVADRLSALMVLLTSIVGLACCLTSCAPADPTRDRGNHNALMLAMLAAICGAFIAGDIFNLYVWFELMLLSSFVLLTLGGKRAQIEGAMKYVTLNLFSSVLFLASVGLIYGATGTLNLAHLSLRMNALDPATATAIASPLLLAFCIKAAVFPVFFWLPASYHTPPPVVSALFAGLLTKVGVYAIYRAVTLLLNQEHALLGDVIVIIAGLTMLTGVLGAVAQNDIRRILSFHIVSQIGYMIMGLGIAIRAAATAPDRSDIALIALGGGVFYILHHIIVKTNLFFIAGAVLRARGTTDLSRLGGMISTHPVLAALFLISGLSLAGIPILSGFWAKLALVRGGLEAESYVIVSVSLLVSILTLFSMMKIWIEVFWKSPPDDRLEERIGPLRYAVIGAMALITITIGVGASRVWTFAEATASQLLDTGAYVHAVLPDAIIAEKSEVEP